MEYKKKLTDKKLRTEESKKISGILENLYLKEIS